MNHIITILITGLLGIIALTGCGKAEEEKRTNTYESITPAEAKAVMDREADYVILDVRTEEEFAERHIEGAVLLPDYEVEVKAEEMLPDKDQLILVYCRSGRRSKNAASILAALGYTNIKEFGGIIDWPY